MLVLTKNLNSTKKMISTVGIEDQVNWLGKVKHEAIPSLMANSDVFLMTSTADGTSSVIVEAISENLPILSFNTCGFGPLVKDFAGVTIELTTPDDSITEFAKQLNHFFDSPDLLDEIKKKQKQQKYKLSWDFKGKRIYEIYKMLLKKQYSE